MQLNGKYNHKVLHKLGAVNVSSNGTETIVSPDIDLTNYEATLLQITREDKITESKQNASVEILAKYPLCKQININALQGYTQADKDAMWVFINGVRDKSNDLKAQLTL